MPSVCRQPLASMHSSPSIEDVYSRLNTVVLEAMKTEALLLSVNRTPYIYAQYAYLPPNTADVYDNLNNYDCDCKLGCHLRVVELYFSSSVVSFIIGAQTYKMRNVLSEVWNRYQI